MPITNTVFPQVGQNTSDATATASQILAPYTAYVATGKVTGTMPPFSEQTAATATSADIVQGKTAWVNGNEVTGALVWTSLSRQLKNGEVSFDGTSLVVPQKVLAIVGTFAWTYNNYARYVTLTAISDENYGGPYCGAFVGGNDIAGQLVSASLGSSTSINGVFCFDTITFNEPQEINGTYNSQSLSQLFIVGVPPSQT